MSATEAASAQRPQVGGVSSTLKDYPIEVFIRVNSVHPGLLNTAMMQKVERQLGAPSVMAANAQLSAFAPLRRYVEPHEIAQVIAFLSNDEASYVTGGGYIVDGRSTTGIRLVRDNQIHTETYDD